MNKRFTLIMTSAVLLGSAVLILMNVAALLGLVPARYISHNDVKGIAIEYNHILYTLNFEQQNALVDIFNRAVPVAKELVEKRKAALTPEIEKIVIYRFHEPNIEIRPVAYVLKSTSAVQASDSDFARLNMVFSAPQWNTNGLLEEATSDEMHRIFQNAYDH